MYVGKTLVGTQYYEFADVSEHSIQVGGDGAVAWAGESQLTLNAVIDDFKIFDQALTQEQVIQMSGAWVCVNKPADDLDGDCIVDINDFAIFAAQWLDCGRFPNTFCN